jgi:hypothetical protein
MSEVMPWTEGQSLVYLGQGGTRNAPVAMEYAAEASQAPLVSLRYGKWKYNRCTLDPDQLFDLEADPHELINLADDPAHAGTLAQLQAKAAARWDLAAFDAAVRESQARRWVVYEAQGRLLPVGLPAAAKGVRALHAQPHGPQRAGGKQALPAGRVMLSSFCKYSIFAGFGKDCAQGKRD